ncbi:MAG: glutathione S-transferase [Paracoccaceae bacterium]
MRLLMSPPSPFARMARVARLELGLADRVEEVAVSSTPMATDPALAAANPLGKIPALVREDGPAIVDSRVICRFLDALAGGPLYPPARIWEVATLEAIGVGLSDAAVAMVYEARFKGVEGASGDWIEAQWRKVARTVEVLEGRWMGHLEGPLDAGGIAVGCALAYLDLRHGARGWRDGAPTLAAWQARMAARESMAATEPG